MSLDYFFPVLRFYWFFSFIGSIMFYFSLCVIFIFLFQSIGVGYKRANPASVVVVQAYDPRPSIRIKASESAAFRRYGFVEAVQELDPAGSLGLLDPDYQVFVFCFLPLCFFGFGFWFFGFGFFS